MISREGDLSSEISKVEREKTPEKVERRHNYVYQNIETCEDILFKKRFEISNVKSIVLCTKPCYYYFVKKNRMYEYLDWVEFEGKVKNREL